jgi:hypothetical protein
MEDKWAKIKTLQKGKHVMSKLHKPLEDIIVYLLYDLEFIGADHISIIVYVLAAIATYYFIEGNLLLALIIAFIVGILDGVDGKIARLRGRKTYIGKLEHSLDMLYEQAWYAAFIWYVWTSTGNLTYLILGFIWLISDSLVRHVYNVFWIATGKSLKYYGGLADKVTLVDGRRSVYILHMIIWFIVGYPQYAIYTILIHCVSTAVIYMGLSLKHLYKT